VDDRECVLLVKKYLSFMPSSCEEPPPFVATDDPVSRREESLLDLVPDNPRRAYDMHKVIAEIVDNGAFFEIKKDFATSIVIGFARFDGWPVGIVANNPMVRAGSLDVDAADKGARFIRFCDAFNLPLVNLQDVPGYLIGNESERKGIIRHGAKMLYSYANATVPKITVVLRKAYAGGYLAMCSKDLGADFVFSLPTAEVCLMGPEGAVNILFRKEIGAAADPAAVRQEKLTEFFDRYVNPYYSAALQHVDDIIDPREMRPNIIRALELSRNKQDQLPHRKHGNMPV